MKPLRPRTLVAVAVATVLGWTMFASATSTGWIPLGGPIKDQGTVPPLGQSDITLTTTASTYTATGSDYWGSDITVTSTVTLTGPVTIVFPLEQGMQKVITNTTLGGFPVIVGGATGTTVTVPNGKSNAVALHCPDGANFTAYGGGGGGSGFDAAATYPGLSPVTSGYPKAAGGTFSYQSSIPVADLAGVVPVSKGGIGSSTPCPSGQFLTGDGTSFFCAPFVSQGDIEAGADATIIVVGLGNHPFDTTVVSPPAGAVPYYRADAGTFSFAPITIGGDLACTSLGVAETCATVSATGGGTNPFDAGVGVFNVIPPALALGSGTNFPVVAEGFRSSFVNATSWVTLWGKPIAANTAEHFALEMYLDDFSGPDASLTKNTLGCAAKFSVFVEVGGGPYILPQAGASLSSIADSGLPTVAIACLSPQPMSGCTSNAGDAGCSPGTALNFTLRAQIAAGNVVQLQGQATGFTNFPQRAVGRLVDLENLP